MVQWAPRRPSTAERGAQPPHPRLQHEALGHQAPSAITHVYVQACTQAHVCNQHTHMCTRVHIHGQARTQAGGHSPTHPFFKIANYCC